MFKKAKSLEDSFLKKILLIKIDLISLLSISVAVNCSRISKLETCVLKVVYKKSLLRFYKLFLDLVGEERY